MTSYCNVSTLTDKQPTFRKNQNYLRKKIILNTKETKLYLVLNNDLSLLSKTEVQSKHLVLCPLIGQDSDKKPRYRISFGHTHTPNLLCFGQVST